MPAPPQIAPLEVGQFVPQQHTQMVRIELGQQAAGQHEDRADTSRSTRISNSPSEGISFSIWLGFLIADREVPGMACAISWQRSNFNTGGLIMKPIVRAVPFLLSVFALALCVIPALAQTGTKQPATYPALPSQIPAQFKPVTSSFDHTRSSVMIPMRDGVKLHTVILMPKGATKAPKRLTRTPYSADKLTSLADS